MRCNIPEIIIVFSAIHNVQINKNVELGEREFQKNRMWSWHTSITIHIDVGCNFRNALFFTVDTDAYLHGYGKLIFHLLHALVVQVLYVFEVHLDFGYMPDLK